MTTSINPPLPPDTFAAHFNAREMRWSVHNVSRLLRSTGERPERVRELKSILGHLGMGVERFAGTWGVFDHGKLWGRDGKPLMVTGAPYGITADERELLGMLARFGTLRVSVDDRPSDYGHGTHHVRIEVVNPVSPFKLFPSTRKTREAACLARRAFESEGMRIASPKPAWRT
jgi:hypothetical protein